MRKAPYVKLIMIYIIFGLILLSSLGSFGATTHSVKEDIDYNGADLFTLVRYSITETHSDFTIRVPETLIIKDSINPYKYEDGNDVGTVTISGLCTKDVIVTADGTIKMSSSDKQEKLSAGVDFNVLTMPAAVVTPSNVSKDIFAYWIAKNKPKIDTWNGKITYRVDFVGKGIDEIIEECTESTMYLFGFREEQTNELINYLTTSNGHILDSSGPNKGVYVMRDLVDAGYLDYNAVSFCFKKITNTSKPLYEAYWTNEDLTNSMLDIHEKTISVYKMVLDMTDADNPVITGSIGRANVISKTVTSQASGQNVDFFVINSNSYVKEKDLN